MATLTYTVQAGSDDVGYFPGFNDTTTDTFVIGGEGSGTAYGACRLTPQADALDAGDSIASATLRIVTTGYDGGELKPHFDDSGANPSMPADWNAVYSLLGGAIAAGTKTVGATTETHTFNVTAAIQSLQSAIGSGPINAILAILQGKEGSGAATTRVAAYEHATLDAVTLEIETGEPQTDPPPPAPTVRDQTTTDRTPKIVGTFDADSTSSLTITFAGDTYTFDGVTTSPSLTVSGPAWTLDIEDELPLGEHTLTATATNDHGSSSTTATITIVPPINQWRGDTPPTATEIIVTVLSAVANALYVVAIGQARYQYRADATDTTADIADQLADRLATSPDVTVEHEDGTDVIRVLGREVGSPLPVTPVPTPLLSVHTIREGKSPSLAKIDLQLPATTTGGTWSLDLAIDGDTPQTIGPLDHNITSSALADAIADQHTDVSSGDVVAELTSTSPRTYRLTLTGALAGRNATAEIDASQLLGNATVNIDTVQRASSVVNELQVITAYFWSDAQPNRRIGFYWDGDDLDALPDPPPTAPIDNDAAIQSLLDDLLGHGNHNTVTIHHLHDSAGSVQTLAVYVEFVGERAGLPQTQLRAYTLEEDDPVTIFARRLKTGGGTENNEFQLVSLLFGSDDQSDTSTYTLTYQGQTTATINKDADNQSQIEAKIEALATVDDVELHLPPINAPWYVVEFTGVHESSPVDTMTISAGNDDDVHSVRVLSHGNALANQIDRVDITADGGTWTYTVEGDTTPAIDWPTTAAEIQTALETARGTADFEVSGNGPFFIEYVGNLAHTPVTRSADASSLTGGKDGDVAYPVPGIPGIDEIQQIAIDKTATGGHVRFGFAGAFSPAVEFPFTAAKIQAGLDAHPAIGEGNATVEGPPAGPWLVTFAAELGWQNVPSMTIDGDQLIVPESAAMTVEIADKGTGPEWFNEPLNWTLGRVPNTGDIVHFPHGATPCTRGLRQRKTWQKSGDFQIIFGNPKDVLDAADFVDGQVVRLSTTGVFPTAQVTDPEDGVVPVDLDSETDFYILSIDPLGKNAQIGLTPDGPPIQFLDAGAGTHTMELRPAQIIHNLAHTGAIGLPPRDPNTQSWEDQPQYLAIGLLPASGDERNLIIGEGAGTGSPRIRLDLGQSPLKALITNTGTGIGRPAVDLLVDNLTTAEIEQLSGDVGIAIEPNETSALRRIVKRGGSLRLGNVTIRDGIDADSVQAARVAFTADGLLALRA